MCESEAAERVHKREERGFGHTTEREYLCMTGNMHNISITGG